MTHRIAVAEMVRPSGLALLVAVVALGGLWSTATLAAKSTGPQIVKNADEPGRTPWDTRSQVLPNAGGCFGESDCFNYSDGETSAIWDLRPVPAGKRWVVQSATGYLSGGINRVNNIELGSPRGTFVFDGNKWAFGGPFQPGTAFSSAIFSVPVYAVFGPGEVPFVRVSATPALGGYTVIIFTGYLIDAT